MERRTKPRKRRWYVMLGILSSSVLLFVSLFMLGSSLLDLAKSQAAFEMLATRVEDETKHSKPPTVQAAPTPYETTASLSPYREPERGKQRLLWLGKD